MAHKYVVEAVTREGGVSVVRLVPWVAKKKAGEADGVVEAEVFPGVDAGGGSIEIQATSFVVGREVVVDVVADPKKAK